MYFPRHVSRQILNHWYTKYGRGVARGDRFRMGAGRGAPWGGERLPPDAAGAGHEEVEDAGYVCIWYISSVGLLSFRDRGTFRARWRAGMGGNTV